MIKGEYTSYITVVWDHSIERLLHAMSNITVMGVFRFFSILPEGIIIILCEEDGKLSIINPVFTGYITIMIEWIVIIL